MISLLEAVGAMTLKDCVATCLTVAEAHNRPLLAGSFDALLDLAQVLVTVFAAGQVIIHGWTAHSMLVLGVMMVTSFFGTQLWTRVGNRVAGTARVYGTNMGEKP